MFKFLKKSFLGSKILSLFQKKVDAETLENLEELFYEADLGVELTQELLEKVNKYHKEPPEKIIEKIKEHLIAAYDVKKETPINAKPHVIMLVGGNGNGKTTSVAKLAAAYQAQGKKVLVAAADTFRAAGVDQLDIWAKRVGCDVVKGKTGSDSASVVFDALNAAKARGHDLVIIDTAGRLPTKTALMDELAKMGRVTKKVIPEAPHETLLVLDATIGKNGLEQGAQFNKYTPLSGIILTKIDGTAKGGVVLSLQKELKIPVRYIGVGEGIEDLKPFNAKEFVEALFE